jgi:hypothetical protein
VIGRPAAPDRAIPAEDRSVEKARRAKEVVMKKYLVFRASMAVGSLAVLVATVGAGRKW